MGSGEVLGGQEEGREGGQDMYHSRGLLESRARRRAGEMTVLTNREEKVPHSRAYYSWAPASRSRAAISAWLYSLAVDSGVWPQ